MTLRTKTTITPLTFDYNQTYYKIVREDRCHNGFTYQHGINKDIHPFEEEDTTIYGLHFTTRENIAYYITYGEYVCKVKIDKNNTELIGTYFEEKDKVFKTSSLYLDWDNRISINEFPWTIDDIRLNTNVVVYTKMEDITEEKCVLFLTQSYNYFPFHLCPLLQESPINTYLQNHLFPEGWWNQVLQLNSNHYIHNQAVFYFFANKFNTFEKEKDLYMQLIKKDPALIEYNQVKQPKEFYQFALQCNGCALKFINEMDQTEEICLFALKQDISAMIYIKKPTVSLYLKAINLDLKAILFMNPTVFQNSYWTYFEFYTICGNLSKELHPFAKKPSWFDTLKYYYRDYFIKPSLKEKEEIHVSKFKYEMSNSKHVRNILHLKMIFIGSCVGIIVRYFIIKYNVNDTMNMYLNSFFHFLKNKFIT